MASLELLLGLFFLSMYIETEVNIFTKRFKYLGYWKTASDSLSGKNLNCEILEHPQLIMPCDEMLARYVFDKPYPALVLSRNDWSNVPIHIGKKCSIWYTDGSKMDKSTGAGVCCPDDLR